MFLFSSPPLAPLWGNVVHSSALRLGRFDYNNNLNTVFYVFDDERSWFFHVNPDFFFYSEPSTCTIKATFGLFCCISSQLIYSITPLLIAVACFFFSFGSSSVFSPSSFEDALQGRAPSSSGLPLKETHQNHLTRSLTFSVCLLFFFIFYFFFRTEGQLHFTGIILDGNVLIIPVNCQRSTLSSIISDSFEFLLAASVHKFHKR